MVAIWKLVKSWNADDTDWFDVRRSKSINLNNFILWISLNFGLRTSDFFFFFFTAKTLRKKDWNADDTDCFDGRRLDGIIFWGS